MSASKPAPDAQLRAPTAPVFPAAARLPMVGLGTWTQRQHQKGEVEEAVRTALRSPGRLLPGRGSVAPAARCHRCRRCRAQGASFHQAAWGWFQLRASASPLSTAIFYPCSLGYRHIDAAAEYQNEDEVGSALAAAMHDGTVRREGALGRAPERLPVDGDLLTALCERRVAGAQHALLLQSSLRCGG